MVLRKPGDVLDVHGLEHLAANQAVRFQQPVDLVHFAAEADHQHRRMVGMGGIAPHHPLQRFETFAGTGHAASSAVDEGNHAVDIRDSAASSSGPKADAIIRRRLRSN